MKKIFILCMSLFLISGCSMKAEYNMNIKNDKSMDFSVTSAFDDELIEAMLSMKDMDSEESDEEKEYTDEEKWKMLEDSQNNEDDEKSPEEYGFTKERYEEKEFKGFKYTKRISNIDDISGTTANFNMEDFAKISESIVFVKNKNNYKANFKLSSDEDTSGYDIGVDIKFSVTLPNKPISHNATTVSEDGKTLTWNLLEKGSKNVEFEFEIQTFSIVPYIYIGTFTLLLIIVLVIFTKKKKKKHNTFEDNTSIKEDDIIDESLIIDPTPISNIETLQTPLINNNQVTKNDQTIQNPIPEINDDNLNQ